MRVSGRRLAPGSAGRAAWIGGRMRRSRIPALARKEFKHIIRDPRSLWIIFMLPNVMMFLFGYAINLDIKNVNLALCDLSDTPASRTLAEDIDGSSYFKIAARYDDPAGTGRFFRTRAAAAAIVIPADFARSLEREGLRSIEDLFIRLVGAQ